MLIDEGNGVAHNLISRLLGRLSCHLSVRLSGRLSVDGIAVSVQLKLFLVVAQLIEQTFAQIATGNAGRIELTHDFQRFVQVSDGEGYRQNPGWGGRRSGGCASVARRGQWNLGRYLGRN